MEEKRQKKRWKIAYFLRVFESDGEGLVGEVVNLHTEGIMLVSDNPIPRNKQLALRMKIPLKNGETEWLYFDAECRWCNVHPNPTLYNAGFSLLNPPEELTRSVEQLIENWALPDNSNN
ncbi:MAG: PilZ domain-containing protein [Planctomycetes bacterium]|nr:PilZ domain-containing protein [Planctomycetota bacterium]